MGTTISLEEIRETIEKQLAFLLEQSKYCVFAEQVATINCAICESVQTLILLLKQNQPGEGKRLKVVSEPTSKEN